MLLPAHKCVQQEGERRYPGHRIHDEMEMDFGERVTHEQSDIDNSYETRCVQLSVLYLHTLTNSVVVKSFMLRC